jgi:hypothetical protein
MSPESRKNHSDIGDLIMGFNRLLCLALTTGLLTGTLFVSAPEAQAKRCWYDKQGRVHCDNGLHKGHARRYSRDGRYYYDDSRRSWFDTRTGKIVKGGLVGAGIGAGAGYLLDRPVGKSAVLGAGVGAGVQATRYSTYMRRHPIVKTATYGALAGAGTAAALKREGDPVKGALWGAAIGTGVGALKHMDD